MTNHSGLLSYATSTLRGRSRGLQRNTELRRATSSAYYALFHGLIEQASDLLVGGSNRRSPRYLLIYRSFDHRSMAKACRSATKPPSRLGIASFSIELQRVATAFVQLQDHRHDADYNPNQSYKRSQVEGFIKLARSALSELKRAPAEQRDLFLTYLLHQGRD